MFYKSDGKITVKVKIFEFYNDLLHIKEKIKLDRTLFRTTIDVLPSMMFLLNMAFSLNSLKEEICLDFLFIKK